MKDVLLTSSVLILALVLLRFLFRRTVSRRVQYALWGLVLLRLLIPVSLPAMKYSVLTAAEPVRDTAVWEAASQVSGLHVPRMSYTRAYEQVAQEARKAGEDLSAFSDSELDSRAYAHMASPLTLRDALHLIWYVGMGFTALLLLLVNLRFARRLRRTRVPLEGTGSKYPVYLCDDIPSPCLFGLCKPAIYVTSPAARDPNTLRYVLAHEETHARHLDPLWSLLRSLCLAVWWFDPLVWLAAHLSRLDGELACDEGALARLGENERIPYGETLLRLIPLGRGGSPMLTATTMTAGKRQMKDRIRRIAEHRRPLLLALVAVLVLAAAVCACTFTGAKENGDQPAGSGETAAPGDLKAGSFDSPEAYLTYLCEHKSLSYYEEGENAARAPEYRVAKLEKEGELSGLVPEGTLELYSYQIEARFDLDREEVLGLHWVTYVTEDGWCDLFEPHTLVLLRYPDGSVSALHNESMGDDMGGLYYYQETPEEMLHDWYVREYGLDLPTYTLDLLPADEGGNHPARRYDGEGWYIYISIPGWEEQSSERVTKWVSRYRTGSSIRVTEISPEELTAERPALLRGQEERYVEGADGRLWRVFTQYDPGSITDTPEVRDEPRLLEAMLESFTVSGGGDRLRRTPEHTVPPTVAEQLRAAADRIFGAYDAPGTGYSISVEAEGERREYAVDLEYVPRGNQLSTGAWLQRAYFWEPLSEEEIAALDRDTEDGAILTAWNETDCFTVYARSDVLCWTELQDGAEHWLRPSGNAESLYAFFLADARRAEMERPLSEISVPGTVTDYDAAARRMAEQYGAILMDFPAWYWTSPYDLALLSVEVFDAYYGEDYPNFCFTMIFALKLDEGNRDYFESGAGLGDPIPEGPYAGWYRWGGEVIAALEDDLWRFNGLNTGGTAVWLPCGVGWGSRFEQLSTEQLVSLWFLTRGRTHDWNLLHYLSQKPAEEVRGELEKLPEERRQALLEGMEVYNDSYGQWYDTFDLEALR